MMMETNMIRITWFVFSFLRLTPIIPSPLHFLFSSLIYFHGFKFYPYIVINFQIRIIRPYLVSELQRNTTKRHIHLDYLEVSEIWVCQTLNYLFTSCPSSIKSFSFPRPHHSTCWHCLWPYCISHYAEYHLQFLHQLPPQMIIQHLEMLPAK